MTETKEVNQRDGRKDHRREGRPADRSSARPAAAAAEVKPPVAEVKTEEKK